MNLTIHTSIATLALIVIGSNANAQGFDCDRMRSATEAAVCNSASLRLLDEQLNIEYAFARRYQLTHRAERRLIRSQRAWLRYRNQCGASRRCLRQVYQRRMRFLGNQIKG